MCGIVGYIGKRPVVPIVINGLKRLEYRGYDSAGIAVIEDSKIWDRKRQGKINELEMDIEDVNLSSTIGIGHTRWATHGVPSKRNAHPQFDCKHQIALVHNGIVENYTQLKAQLESDGHRFESETDTEVLVHLIEMFYKGDLAFALREALQLVEGTFGILVLSSLEPDRVLAARRGSPLVIGVGEGETFVASDGSKTRKWQSLIGRALRCVHSGMRKSAKLSRNFLSI